MREGAPPLAGSMKPVMHRMAQADFNALADGPGTAAGLAQLCIAERSKHILLLYEVLVKAADEHPAVCAELRMCEAFRLLVRAEESQPETVAELLSLPGTGAWAVECLLRLGRGAHEETALRADLARFNEIAAASGLRTGLEFTLPVPLRDGRLVLPAHSPLDTSLSREYAVLRHSVGGTAVLDDGSEYSLPSPLAPGKRLRIKHAGAVLDVYVNGADPYLSRDLRHSLGHLDDAAAGWPDRLTGAWRILAVNHADDAAAIATIVNTVVPLKTDRITNIVSATSTTAFGAIATSLPPDDVTLAETLVHECQHLKLCALLDMFPMVRDDCDDLYYAPWRDDPRPLRGLLQGAYAYFGVTRFWRTQRRHAPSGEALRGHVEFARWRSETLAAVRTLLGSHGLTDVGARFAARMHARLSSWRHDAVPEHARRMAAEVSADHAVLWRLRHLACDPDLADRVAASWRAGVRPDGAASLGKQNAALRVMPSQVDGSCSRSMLLTLRYTNPERFRTLLADPAVPGSFSLSLGDLALLRGDHAAAVAAYRSEIRVGAGSAEAWAGLVAAIRILRGNRSWHVLLTWAPVLSAVHSRVGGADPLELAAWLTGSHQLSQGWL